METEASDHSNVRQRRRRIVNLRSAFCVRGRRLTLIEHTLRRAQNASPRSASPVRLHERSLRARGRLRSRSASVSKLRMNVSDLGQPNRSSRRPPAPISHWTEGRREAMEDDSPSAESIPRTTETAIATQAALQASHCSAFGSHPHSQANLNGRIASSRGACVEICV